jgi:hypothetical protein
MAGSTAIWRSSDATGREAATGIPARSSTAAGIGVRADNTDTRLTVRVEPAVRNEPSRCDRLVEGQQIAEALLEPRQRIDLRRGNDHLQRHLELGCEGTGQPVLEAVESAPLDHTGRRRVPGHQAQHACLEHLVEIAAGCSRRRAAKHLFREQKIVHRPQQAPIGRPRGPHQRSSRRQCGDHLEARLILEQARVGHAELVAAVAHPSQDLSIETFPAAGHQALRAQAARKVFAQQRHGDVDLCPDELLCGRKLATGAGDQLIDYPAHCEGRRSLAADQTRGREAPHREVSATFLEPAKELVVAPHLHPPQLDAEAGCQLA